ncbi:MAG TPA: sigma factor [Enhygromyxa sp.]|nr:sigma factor [Enhygromyxa sp.]
MSDSEKLEGLDDAELVRRTRAGDNRAGGVLLQRHQRSVRRVFQLNVSDLDAVDDLTQETMLTGFRNLSALERPESFRAWMLGVAYNKLKRPEIAEILGIPVGTVGGRLSYARKQLRDRLDALEIAHRPLHDTTRPIEKWQLWLRGSVSAMDSSR